MVLAVPCGQRVRLPEGFGATGGGRCPREHRGGRLLLGAKGCLADHHGEQIAVPALPVSPIDTVGAGDAFCGAFAAALDAGESFSTALRWGCVAGSLTCLKTGAQTALPTREESAAHLSSLPA